MKTVQTQARRFSQQELRDLSKISASIARTEVEWLELSRPELFQISLYRYLMSRVGQWADPLLADPYDGTWHGLLIEWQDSAEFSSLLQIAARG